MNRDQMYMKMARVASMKSSCQRLSVGCVIVKDGSVISTGYNGAIDGMATCEEEGCFINDQGRCIRTVHAEMRAVLSAPRSRLKGATIYVTHEPCEQCAKHLHEVGIARIVYQHEYKNQFNQYFLEGMLVEQH